MCIRDRHQGGGDGDSQIDEAAREGDGTVEQTQKLRQAEGFGWVRAGGAGYGGPHDGVPPSVGKPSSVLALAKGNPFRYDGM